MIVEGVRREPTQSKTFTSRPKRRAVEGDYSTVLPLTALIKAMTVLNGSLYQSTEVDRTGHLLLLPGTVAVVTALPKDLPHGEAVTVIPLQRETSLQVGVRVLQEAVRTLAAGGIQVA